MSSTPAGVIRHADFGEFRTAYDPSFVSALKLKTPPGSRLWDKAAKVWRVDEPWVDAVIELARRAYGGVEVLDRRKPESTASDWAGAMFDAVPERLHALAYKRLAMVLHPDQGGDPEAMKILNAAHDRAVA